MKKLFLAISIFLFAAGAIAQPPKEGRPPRKNDGPKGYNIQQATSERAQLHTIAFDGLAFFTGNFGADCFFPPGKVADFFGFQFMRDNDANKHGHNTDFLTNIATNTMAILNKEQMQKLITLAQEQENLYDDFARKRWTLIKAFRENMEAKGAKTLNKDAVIKYTAALYEIDANLSYGRAKMMGEVISSLTPEQKAAFDKLQFGNSATWPPLPEKLDKQGLSHRAHVGVMTYASELFSWYKGSLEADVYFCPERHGTYFGGFYMKDFPAMGNHGYNISTSLTGDAGKAFLETLTAEQRQAIETLPATQKKCLDEIVRLRGLVATELRKFMAGQTADKKLVFDWIKKYGEQDGEMSYYYATAFATVYKTLTAEQKAQLKVLRAQDVLPEGTYLYSDKVAMVDGLDTRSLFK